MDYLHKSENFWILGLVLYPVARNNESMLSILMLNFSGVNYDLDIANGFQVALHY